MKGPLRPETDQPGADDLETDKWLNRLEGKTRVRYERKIFIFSSFMLVRNVNGLHHVLGYPRVVVFNLLWFTAPFRS